MACIHLISVGSRGDLEPYLALLKELQERGHTVHLIGSPNFQEAAEDAGMRFTSLPGDFRELMASEDGLQLMEGKPIRLIQNNLLTQWLETARTAIDGCDLLITPPLALWGYHLAEAEGCRFAVVSPIPLIRTTTFPFLNWPGNLSGNEKGLAIGSKENSTSSAMKPFVSSNGDRKAKRFSPFVRSWDCPNCPGTEHPPERMLLPCCNRQRFCISSASTLFPAPLTGLLMPRSRGSASPKTTKLSLMTPQRS